MGGSVSLIDGHIDKVLKPCPFCGYKARMKRAQYNLFGAYGAVDDDREWFGVWCFNCGVSQPKKKYDTKEQAIEAWNRRADT